MNVNIKTDLKKLVRHPLFYISLLASIAASYTFSAGIVNVEIVLALILLIGVTSLLIFGGRITLTAKEGASEKKQKAAVYFSKMISAVVFGITCGALFAVTTLITAWERCFTITRPIFSNTNEIIGYETDMMTISFSYLTTIILGTLAAFAFTTAFFAIFGNIIKNKAIASIVCLAVILTGYLLESVGGKWFNGLVDWDSRSSIENGEVITVVNPETQKLYYKAAEFALTELHNSTVTGQIIAHYPYLNRNVSLITYDIEKSAVTLVRSIFWMTLTSLGGYLIFRKKEIK